MKTSRHFHKLWACVLVLALCLSTIPVLAMASDGVLIPPEIGVGSRELPWLWTDGGESNAVTISVKFHLESNLDDVTEPFYIGTEATAVNVILDLRGYTITSAKRAFVVSPGSSLTICDSVGGGQVQGAEVGDDQPGGVVRVDSGATLTLQSGTIENVAKEAHQSDGGSIYVAKAGTLNISGGIVRGGAAADNIYVCGTVNLTLDNTENETAIALDGQLLAQSDAVIQANVGVVEILENGQQVWRIKKTAPVSVPGDMNGDKLVTNEDVVALLWHSLFPEEIPLEVSGDLNGDGDVTNEDVVKLLWYSLFPEDNPL